MKVSILQSNYIPWKGYFDIINMADFFVIYDEVQYTKNDWRNRNLIKTPNGTKWISIPCYIKSLNQKICETEIADEKWADKHFKTLTAFYNKSPFFSDYKPYIESLYFDNPSLMLSEVNKIFISGICRILGINTTVIDSRGLNFSGDRTEKLVHICKLLNADTYISGPAAKNYLDESLFEDAGVKVQYVDYQGYRDYPQLFPPFIHEVSILDLIFNTGSEAQYYLKSAITKIK